MNKKALSVIIAFALVGSTFSNVFASSASTSEELTQTQNNKKELQVKVDTLNKQIDGVIGKIDSNKKDMNTIAKNIKNTQIKLSKAQDDSKSQNDLFKKRVKAMYTTGTNGYLQVLLSSNNLGDFISRVDSISRVMKFDNQVITKLKGNEQAIQSQQKALSAENAKLESLKVSNESTLSKLNNDIQQQKELLSQATAKEQQLIALQTAQKAPQIPEIKASSPTLSRGGSGSLSYSQALTMEATAYCGDAITASGSATVRNPNGYSTIAVDPRVIPLGTKVYVEGYGYAVACDTGGAIKGNIIDLFVNSESEAENWGRRSVTVYILN
ncbi:3D domain-containing protein [Clostridium coskatii]|uniref:Cell wall-binding protein YocH n=1 Tax=Clostridium coskatii TaxID=1705578 RepID=A0A168P4A1_9CLOT|nr:3D domain-containing protein [Clostridium coskatii]OAA87287.1 Cell wall-binding protein YocH precursor [Clostridium coskatii]OBR97772.1 cell wall-binding protein YocH precursor [Clostridium coskatii]